MFPEFSLKGKCAIVTGSGRNIGQGVAICLAEAGADVVVMARTETGVEETAREIEKLGRRAVRVVADATQAADVQRLVDTALSELGQIDILVNNVGGGGAQKFLAPVPGYRSKGPDDPLNTRMTLDEWRATIDLNLTSAFLCCRAVGPHMLGRKRGRVINITSPSGTRPVPRLLAYGTAKAALDMFTRALAQEWAPDGVTVNGLGPGLIPNRATAADPGRIARMVSTIPMHRVSTPREVGLLAAYMASDASSFMTGQIVHVDGGQLLI